MNALLLWFPTVNTLISSFQATHRFNCKKCESWWSFHDIFLCGKMNQKWEEYCGIRFKEKYIPCTICEAKCLMPCSNIHRIQWSLLCGLLVKKSARNPSWVLKQHLIAWNFLSFFKEISRILFYYHHSLDSYCVPWDAWKIEYFLKECGTFFMNGFWWFFSFSIYFLVYGVIKFCQKSVWCFEEICLKWNTIVLLISLTYLMLFRLYVNTIIFFILFNFSAKTHVIPRYRSTSKLDFTAGFCLVQLSVVMWRWDGSRGL